MIFKDLESLAEAYTMVINEAKKPDQDKDGVPDWADKHPGKNDKEKEEKPKASKVKKKLPFMKEEKSSFNTLFQSIMSEGKKLSFGPSSISGPFEHDKRVWMLRRLSNGEISNINEEEQYLVTWKNPEKHNGQREQPLKGESVLPFLDEIESIQRAFPEEP
jgi:hypothetical protein